MASDMTAVGSAAAVVELLVSVDVVAAVVDEDVVVVVDEVAVLLSPSSSSPPQAASIAITKASAKSTAKGRVISIARLEFFNLDLLAFPSRQLPSGHIPVTAKVDIIVCARYFFTAFMRAKWLHRPATLPGHRQLSTTSGFSTICGGM